MHRGVTLLELQREFSSALTADCAFAGSTASGFDIYRNNYHSQLRAALEGTFGHLRIWVGDTEFRRLADAHIRQSPPCSWTLDAYGLDFPATLRCLYPADPEIAELAWLDLAMAEAFVAADAEPLTRAEVSPVDWDKARIQFVPSLRLAEATTNAADIWLALESGEVAPDAVRLADKRGYVVWRRDLISCFRVVSECEHASITTLRRGMSFAEACEILALELGDGEAALVAAGLLRWLLDDALIAGIAG
jgi:hypothetical protein